MDYRFGVCRMREYMEFSAKSYLEVLFLCLYWLNGMHIGMQTIVLNFFSEANFCYFIDMSSWLCLVFDFLGLVHKF